jgi:hypothetical protein
MSRRLCITRRQIALKTNVTPMCSQVQCFRAPRLSFLTSLTEETDIICEAFAELSRKIRGILDESFIPVRTVVGVAKTESIYEIRSSRTSCCTNAASLCSISSPKTEPLDAQSSFNR